MDSLNANNDALFKQIEAKYRETKERIGEAAVRSGRSEKDVLLVAVSKYAEPDDGIVDAFLRCGATDLAENRPQKFLAKAEYWRESPYWNERRPTEFVPAIDRDDASNALRWHFIGNLQRNKARRILPFVSLIHSVDSWKLLEALERILDEEAERGSENDPLVFPKRVSVLLEVHISDDDSKQGFSFEEAERALPTALELKRVEVRGLMGMAGLSASRDETRRQFASLRELLERLRERYPEARDFRELSMGMSGDYETAIEEGSTIVRIGSSLYPQK